MFAVKLDIVWFLIIVHVSNCQRRIQNGEEVTSEKPYVVYLVKAENISTSPYDSWLCGGTLVTSEYVVTSAACIKDVDFLYVIAGYKKYVTDKNIDTDQCTSKMKKKVIYTCYPEAYKLDYERTDQWSQIDIGVAKVESPYDFEDQTYKTLCSYIPAVIPISYEAKDHQAGIDAIVLGWGHKDEWRKVSDDQNYNQGTLNYAPVVLMDKENCSIQFTDVGEMPGVIENYMICTQDAGSMNDMGIQIKKPSVEGSDEDISRDGSGGEDDYSHQYDTRREIKGSNQPSVASTMDLKNKTILYNKRADTNGTTLLDRTINISRSRVSNTNFRSSRRNGICQNDHGGPLVAWAGTHEVLIGVASVFKVDSDFKCTGPYLYTSTQCTGAFLDCILTRSTLKVSHKRDRSSDSRRALCKKTPREKGYATVERHISWLYHPAGAADHEKHLNYRNSGLHVNNRATRTNDENVKLNEGKVIENPANAMNPANNIKPENNLNPANNNPQLNKKRVSVNDAINERYRAKYVHARRTRA